MNERGDKTEVVNVRMTAAVKKRLQEIAAAEYRTFGEQCRLALDDWLEWYEKAEKET